MRLAIVALTLLSACATTGVPDAERAAVCAAQRFLLVNGYLDQPPIEQAISFEMWDAFTYGDGESVDLAELSAGRRNTLTGALYGVSRREYGYVVLYRTEDALRGVQISDDGGAYMPHAYFRMPRDVTRLSERSLTCSEP